MIWEGTMGRLATLYGFLRLITSLLRLLAYMQYLRLWARVRRWSYRRAFRREVRGLPKDLSEELIRAYDKALEEAVRVPGIGRLMSLPSLVRRRSR